MKNKAQIFIIVFFLLSLPFLCHPLEDLTLSREEQTILQELRCITCPGQSVLGSHSDFATTIRKFVKIELERGQTPKQIKTQLVKMYGEEILLMPTRSPHNILLWLLAPLGIMIAIARLIGLQRRMIRRK